MKIGIDARMLGEGFGIGRYLEQLIKHLQNIDQENQYVLFVSNVRTYELKYEHTNYEKNNFRVIEVNIPWYSWAEQIKFKKIIQKEKVDLMHFPHWNAPLFYNDPFVVTIHDLIMFHFPRPEATTLGPIKFWLKDMAHRIVIKNSVKKAKHIFVTSEFTKQDAHKTLLVPLHKMTTTYQAPFSSNPKFEIRNSKQILEKYGITKPFVLYVGSAYPHKNLVGLLQAWKIFQNKYGEDYQLVLVGKENYFYNKIKTNKLINELSNNLIFTSFVPDDELSILYAQAKLYVFPSLYEGFGLPPLEAMAVGTPVASSNRTCLPEVLGEAALYFDPENYEQMADVVYKGLTDENLRYELRQKAREELKRYSWERLAKETLDFYKK